MKGSPLTVSFSGRMRTHGQGRNTSGQRNTQNIQRWKTGVDFRPLDFGQVQWLWGIPVWKGWQLLGFGAHASAQEEEREKGERERGREGRRKKGCWTRLIRILCNASLRPISELNLGREAVWGGGEKWGKPCLIVPILERWGGVWTSLLRLGS